MPSYLPPGRQPEEDELAQLLAMLAESSAEPKRDPMSYFPPTQGSSDLNRSGAMSLLAQQDAENARKREATRQRKESMLRMGLSMGM